MPSYWLWALESQSPSKQKLHAASVKVIEERKLPTFTRIHYGVIQRGRCAFEHLTGALHATAQILDESTQQTTIGRQQNSSSESRSCVTLSKSRDVDEHTGGTKGVHIALCTLRSIVNIFFWMRLVYLPTVSRMKGIIE